MKKRTLSLKRETLSELTGAELQGVAGGAPPTLNVRECLDTVATGCRPPTFEYSCLNCISHPPCTI